MFKPIKCNNFLKITSIFDSTYSMKKAFSLANPTSSINYPLIILMVLAFIIRLLMVGQVIYSPISEGFAKDSGDFHRFAVALLNGHFASDARFLNPFFPIFISFIYFFTGPHQQVILYVFVLLEILSIFLIWQICMKCWGKWAAIFAASFYAFNGMSILYTGFMFSSILDVFLLLLIVKLLLQPKALWSSLLAGFIFGLLALSRSNMILLFAFLPFYYLRRHNFIASLKDLSRQFIPFAFSFLMVMTSMAVINKSSGRSFTPFSAQGGLTFYIGNSANSSGTYYTPEGLSEKPVEVVQTASAMASQKCGEQLSDEQASTWWFKQGILFWKDHPLDAIILLFKKALMFFRKEEFSVDLSYSFVSELIPVLSIPFLSYGLLAPFALTGLYFSFQCKERFRLMEFLFLASFISVVLFFISDKLRFIVVPVMAIYSGYMLSVVPRLFNKFNKHLLIRGALFFLISALLINVNMAFIPHATSRYVDLNNLGVALRSKGRIQEAEAAFIESVRLNPNYKYAYNNLGNLYQSNGNYEAALAHYSKALSIDPNMLDCNESAAYALMSLKRYSEAEKVFEFIINNKYKNETIIKSLSFCYSQNGNKEKALELLSKEGSSDIALNITKAELLIESGRNNEAYLLSKDLCKNNTCSAIEFKDLSSLMNSLHRYDEAIQLAEKAIEEQPGLGDAYYMIAFASMKKGEKQKAIDNFSYACDNNTEIIRAYYYLGNMFFFNNQYKEAEAIYKRGIQKNASFADLFFNLAVVYIKQNRNSEALKMLLKTVELNPEHKDAANLLKQLK